MTSVNEIINEIKSLPVTDFVFLKKWMDELDADRWDCQIESDVIDGKLEKLSRAVLTDAKSGNITIL